MKNNKDGKSDIEEGMSGKVSSSTNSKGMRVSITDLENEKKAVLMERSAKPTPGVDANQTAAVSTPPISQDTVRSDDHQASAFERRSMNEKITDKANDLISSLTSSENAYVYLPPNPVPVTSDQQQDEIAASLSEIDEEYSDDKYVEPEAKPVDKEEQKEENDTENVRPSLPNDKSTLLKALGNNVAIAQKVEKEEDEKEKEKKKKETGCKAVAKRYKMLVILGIILFTGLIITAIVVPLTTKGNDNDNDNDKGKGNANDDDNDKGKKKLSELQSKIKGVAQQITPLATLEDPSSFQFSALQWMFDNDSLVTLENFNQVKVLQRYICTVLYFATNGPTWKTQSKFLTNEDTCSWNDVVNGTMFGVRNCNDKGEVTNLFLGM